MRLQTTDLLVQHQITTKVAGQFSAGLTCQESCGLLTQLPTGDLHSARFPRIIGHVSVRLEPESFPLCARVRGLLWQYFQADFGINGTDHCISLTCWSWPNSLMYDKNLTRQKFNQPSAPDASLSCSVFVSAYVCCPCKIIQLRGQQWWDLTPPGQFPFLEYLRVQ